MHATTAAVPAPGQTTAVRRLGIAWVLLPLAPAIHVADEALTGFPSIYNPTVNALRARLGFWPIPLRVSGLARGAGHGSRSPAGFVARGIPPSALDSSVVLCPGRHPADERSEPRQRYGPGKNGGLGPLSAARARFLLVAPLAGGFDLRSHAIAQDSADHSRPKTPTCQRQALLLVWFVLNLVWFVLNPQETP
jgi:hypothetical protein